MAEVAEIHPHLPRVDHSWTTGTIMAAATSAMSMLTMLGTIVWFSAHLDGTVRIIPDIQKQQIINSESIAVLQSQMNYTNIRYAEIQLALAKINEKLDRRDK